MKNTIAILAILASLSANAGINPPAYHGHGPYSTEVIESTALQGDGKLTGNPISVWSFLYEAGKWSSFPVGVDGTNWLAYHARYTAEIRLAITASVPALVTCQLMAGPEYKKTRTVIVNGVSVTRSSPPLRPREQIYNGAGERYVRRPDTNGQLTVSDVIEFYHNGTGQQNFIEKPEVFVDTDMNTSSLKLLCKSDSQAQVLNVGSIKLKIEKFDPNIVAPIISLPVPSGSFCTRLFGGICGDSWQDALSKASKRLLLCEARFERYTASKDGTNGRYSYHVTYTDTRYPAQTCSNNPFLQQGWIAASNCQTGSTVINNQCVYDKPQCPTGFTLGSSLCVKTTTLQ